MKKIFLFLGLFLCLQVFAQETEKAKPLTFSGYLEPYYSFDLGNPDGHERPGFFYSYNRHNEFNVNLGFLKANYTGERVRGNLALMAGSYAQYNLAAEQSMLRFLFEANVGVKVSKKSNLWIDAGVMPSHIGFESAIGKDCWNLTRGILAENSPYYEAGVKVGYTTPNEKLYLAAMYLNGWQRIQRVSGNQTPAFGTQVTYKPSDKITVNWSTFIGNDQPDGEVKMRYFNNFYTIAQLNDKFGLTAGFDIGVQQRAEGSSEYDAWYTPVLIARYTPSEHWRVAARAEYYADANGVIIATGTPNGFKTFGYSLNLDYLPIENVMFRIEGRGLNSQDEIFLLDNAPSQQNFFFTTSIALSF